EIQTVLVRGTLDLDFNDDSSLDVLDLDSMLGEGPIDGGVMVSETSSQFDLNGDGLIDLNDRDIWLAEAASENGLGSSYRLGDANLDGVVDVTDFNLWNANKFTMSLNWSDANFNGDGFIDTSDFNLWNANKFTMSDAAFSSVVPEPTGLVMAVFGLLAAVGLNRR
ncbi:MAG: hypothetical protein AAF497_06595, partial [Planctomycetota bacterium]